MPTTTASASTSLGYLEESSGSLQQADEAHHRVLELARPAGAVAQIASGLEGLAGVAVARGDVMRGSELLRQAEALRIAHNQPPQPLEHPDIRRITRLVHGDLAADARTTAVHPDRAATSNDDPRAVR